MRRGPPPRKRRRKPFRSSLPRCGRLILTVNGIRSGRWGISSTQANPDFDTRTYGAPKLSDLVRRLPRFEVRQGPGGQLELRDIS